MRMSAGRFACVACVCAAAWVAGCKPSAEKRAALEQKLNQEMEALVARAQACQAQGQLDEALALATRGLANAKYAPQKPAFFALKVDLLIAKGDAPAAGALLLKAFATDPALARGLADRPYNHYLQQNNFAAALAWCEQLLGLGAFLPEDLRAQALSWHLTSSLATRDAALGAASLDRVAAALQPPEAAALLQPALNGLVDAGQHALAAALAQHLAEKGPPAAPVRELVAALKLRCLLAASDWAGLPPAFEACVATLPDEPLARLLRQTFMTLQKGGQRDLLEKLSQAAAFSGANKAGAVGYAARQWVECGVSQNRKVLVERLDALLKADISPIQVGNLFDRYFYEMVSDLDAIRGLCALGERLLELCKDENTVNNVKVKILDGAFLVENYDLAVKMLEDGIPGKDKAWHDMSLPKVKAHRALAQKNPREAVKYFREFMNTWLASDQQEEFDPTSGVAYSREWILGRNANRIANILDSIPDKAEADKARAEAKAYFKVAVEKAKPDAEATRLIQEETKDLGL